MSRGKRIPVAETLSQQIEKAQAKVLKYSEPYHNAIAELKVLLDQKTKSQQQRLLEAVAASKHSYDEIMEFIQSDPDADEW